MTDYEKIRQFVLKRTKLTKSENLNEETPLFQERLLDSFGMLELVAYVEDTFHLNLKKDEVDLKKFNNIRSILEFLETKRSSTQ